MNKFTMKLILVLLLSFLFALLEASSNEGGDAIISENLIKAITNQPNGTFNFIIALQEGVNAVYTNFEDNISSRVASRSERIALLRSNLVAHADLHQQPIIDFIMASKKERHTLGALILRRLWITNEIHVYNGDRELISALSRNRAVSKIAEQIHVSIPKGEIETATTVHLQQNEPEWGVDRIDAVHKWGEGFRGQGIIVGQIDTGVLESHIALRENYIKDYGWYDPELLTSSPRDTDGHGTHVMGTAVGKNGIGVAPDAKWMACLGLPRGEGDSGTLLRCAEFLLCPTDPAGNSPDCSRAPHVVVNSWGGATGGQNWFDSAIRAWRLADIIPVFAAGNSGNGASCRNLNSPGDSGDVLSVGATDERDAIAVFSSVGPSSLTCTIKPDICAPGVQILSSLPSRDDAFGYGQGTSMAAPHVAGAVAIILSQFPHWTFNDVKGSLLTAANTESLNITGPVSCGGIDRNTFPNHVYGYGRLSLKELKEISHSDECPQLNQGCSLKFSSNVILSILLFYVTHYVLLRPIKR